MAAAGHAYGMARTAPGIKHKTIYKSVIMIFPITQVEVTLALCHIIFKFRSTVFLTLK